MMSSMSILIPTYLILAVAICGSSAAEIFDYANRRGDERTPSRQSYYGTIGKGQQLNSNQQNRSQPSPTQRFFHSPEACIEACIMNCHPIGGDGGAVIYLCLQLKPPEPSIPDRLFKQASWPWLLFLSVLGAAFVFCLICMCWSCCCRGSSHSRVLEPNRSNMNANGLHNGGQHYVDGSHNLITRDHRIDDIMQTMPLQGKLNLNGGARNGGEISASKCVADV